MASYPTYNPSVWTGGISSRQFRDLFGTGARRADPEPGHPGRVRAGLDLEGHLDRGRRWRTGYTAAGRYGCPGAVTSAATRSTTGPRRTSARCPCTRRWCMSCDTVFYQLAYQMWLHDNPAPTVSQPAGPDPADAEDGAGLGVRPRHRDRPAGGVAGHACPPGSGCTTTGRSTRTTGASTATQNGSYVQQIEYDDCQTGYVWTPGQAAIAAIGQGYVTVTPLQLARAYAALANGGTLYSPRIGEALLTPAGQVVQRINAAGDRAPAGAAWHAGLHQERAGRRRHPGHGGGRVRRVPAEQAAGRGQDRHRRGVRAARPPRCSPRSRRPATPSTWWW